MYDPLKKQDYINLWMHFESRATSVKGAMFNTITWILGLAGALLGFIAVKLTVAYPSTAELSLGWLLIYTSMLGLALCAYAYFALRESVTHIQTNWDRSDNCKKKVSELTNNILPSRYDEPKNCEKKVQEPKEHKLPLKKKNKKWKKLFQKLFQWGPRVRIWWRLGIIVFGFFIAFVLTLFYGVALLNTDPSCPFLFEPTGLNF